MKFPAIKRFSKCKTKKNIQKKENSIVVVLLLLHNYISMTNTFSKSPPPTDTVLWFSFLDNVEML